MTEELHPVRRETYKPKKIRVRASVEYEIEVADWWKTKEEVEFYLNECTRCKDHIIEEIQELIARPEDDGEQPQHYCLCWIANYEYLGDVESPKQEKEAL